MLKTGQIGCSEGVTASIIFQSLWVSHVVSLVY